MSGDLDFDAGEGGEREPEDLLAEQRVIFVRPVLDDTEAGRVAAGLLALEADDARADVQLYINTSEGTMSGVLALIDALGAAAPDVGTICLGRAAAAGAALLAAGTPGKRLCLPNATVTLAYPRARIESPAGSIAAHAEQVRRERRRFEELLARHAGRDPETIVEALASNRMLNAEEARAFGIVDAVGARPRPPRIARFRTYRPDGGNGASSEL